MYSILLPLSILAGGSYYKYIFVPMNAKANEDFWFELVGEMEEECPIVMVDENGRLYYNYV
jgi:hypothetical protein